MGGPSGVQHTGAVGRERVIFLGKQDDGGKGGPGVPSVRTVGQRNGEERTGASAQGWRTGRGWEARGEAASDGVGLSAPAPDSVTLNPELCSFSHLHRGAKPCGRGARGDGMAVPLSARRLPVRGQSVPAGFDGWDI